MKYPIQHETSFIRSWLETDLIGTFSENWNIFGKLEHFQYWKNSIAELKLNDVLSFFFEFLVKITSHLFTYTNLNDQIRNKKNELCKGQLSYFVKVCLL